MPGEVAFIGAGGMGGRMAHRLLAGNHRVAVCDPSEIATGPLKDAGARVFSTPREASSCQTVIIMVATEAHFVDVTVGGNGLVHGIEPSRPPTVLVMSTVLPKTLQDVAATLVASGAFVIDAPVSGGLVGAEQGTLSIMLGGHEEDIVRVEPLLRLLGRQLFRCGQLGAAQAVKLLNNAIGLTNIYLNAEILVLAKALDVDPGLLLPVLEASTGRSFMSQELEATKRQYANWAATPESFEALSRVSRKDIQLAEQLASAAGLNLPTLSAVSAVIQSPPTGTFKAWNSIGSD